MTETEEAIADVLRIEKENFNAVQEQIRLEREQTQAEFNYICHLEETVNQQKDTISYLILNLKEEKQRRREAKKQKETIVVLKDALTKEETKLVQSVVKRPYKFVIGLLSTVIIILGVLLWNSHFNDRYEVIVFAQAIQGCTQALEEQTEEIEDSIGTIREIMKEQDDSLDKIEYLKEYYQMIEKDYPR